MIKPDFQRLVEEAANFTSDSRPDKPFLTNIKINVPIPPQVAIQHMPTITSKDFL